MSILLFINIGGYIMYIRNCPICTNIIEYKFKSGWHKATKNKSLCKKCSAQTYRKSKYDIRTETIDDKLYYVRECPSCKKELKNVNYRKYWDALKYNKLCKSCAAIKKYGLNKLNNCEYIGGKRKFYRICPCCNNKIYYDALEKVNRFANSLCKSCAPLSQKYVYPNYNQNACKLIDDYGKLHGYNFQHALNGGEFLVPNTKYFVDGYDKEKNVVIEVDETYHKYQTEKDILRQERIIDELNCEFIRLSFNEYKHNYITPRSARTVYTKER